MSLHKLDISFAASPGHGFDVHEGPDADTLPISSAGSGSAVRLTAACGLHGLSHLTSLQVLMLRGEVGVSRCALEALATLSSLTTLTLWTKVRCLGGGGAEESGTRNASLL